MSSEDTVSLMEAFRARHSCRTFGGDTFPEAKMSILQQIVEEVNALPTPFGTQTKVSIHGPGLGRIGFIKNESGWLLGQVKADTPKENLRRANVDVAYRLQHAVMKMTQHKINTVWVGGTYNQGKAEKSCPDWKVPVVVAFGEEKDPHFIWRVMKWIGTSDKRKPFEQLFYDAQANKPIKEDEAGDRLDLFKALQSGPSALNKQPWRFVVDGPAVHVFDAGGDGYSCFDVGIAAANLNLLGGLQGHGEITVRDPAPAPSPLKGTYVCTATLA